MDTITAQSEITQLLLKEDWHRKWLHNIWLDLRLVLTKLKFCLLLGLQLGLSSTSQFAIIIEIEDSSCVDMRRSGDIE